MKGKNDDLVQAALEIQESIRRAYRRHEEHRPVMLFHIQEDRQTVPFHRDLSG